MEKLKEFISEKSTKQLCAIKLINLIGSFGILIIWGYLSISKGELQKMDSSTVWIFMGMNGSHLFQRYLEQKDTPTTTQK